MFFLQEIAFQRGVETLNNNNLKSGKKINTKN